MKELTTEQLKAKVAYLTQENADLRNELLDLKIIEYTTTHHTADEVDPNTITTEKIETGPMSATRPPAQPETQGVSALADGGVADGS